MRPSPELLTNGEGKKMAMLVNNSPLVNKRESLTNTVDVGEGRETEPRTKKMYKPVAVQN